MMPPLAIVVAVSKNGYIGKDGGLPWHLPEDLKHFRRLTLGHTIIMGRKTYDSIGRPLPGRKTVVVSRNPELRIDGCAVARSLDEAIEIARRSDPEPRIVGGESLYRESLPRATRIYLTDVQRDVEGDARFVELDAEAWREAESRPGESRDVVFRTLDRRNAERI